MPEAGSIPAGLRAALSAAGLLGFAFGGFFDGILLHQILQWHHLLSGLEGDAWRDLRIQVLADGLFHAVMYGLAGLGLWQLWRARRELTRPEGGRVMAAGFLVGFGGWHLLDAVLNHWILGLHHIRMESDNRLFWDLAFFVLGLLLTLAGLWLRGRPAGGGPGGRRSAVALSIAVLLAAIAAATPTRGGATLLLVPRNTPASEVLGRVAALDGRVISGNGAAGLWLVRLPADTALAERLGLGALPFATPILGLGCFRTG